MGGQKTKSWAEDLYTENRRLEQEISDLRVDNARLAAWVVKLEAALKYERSKNDTPGP